MAVVLKIQVLWDVMLLSTGDVSKVHNASSLQCQAVLRTSGLVSTSISLNQQLLWANTININKVFQTQLTKLYFAAAWIPSLTDPHVLVSVTNAQNLLMSNSPDITSKLCITGMFLSTHYQFSSTMHRYAYNVISKPDFSCQTAMISLLTTNQRTNKTCHHHK